MIQKIQPNLCYTRNHHLCSRKYSASPSFKGCDLAKAQCENVITRAVKSMQWKNIKISYITKDYEKPNRLKASALVQKNTPLKKIFDFAELKIKNFHKVSDKYYRGSFLSCEYDVARLKEKYGVSTIINFSSKVKKEVVDFAKKNGIEYIHLPFSASVPPSDKQINEFLDIVSHSKGPVYAHCFHGVDRTGIMTAVYQVEEMGIKPESALSTMLKYGHQQKKYPELTEYLKERYLL